MPNGTRIYRNSNLTLQPGVQTPIPFTNTRWEDTPTYWDVSLPTRITIPQAGRYHVFAALGFNDPNYAFADAFVKLNGVWVIARDKREIDPGNSYLTLSTIWQFAASDYIELIVWTNAYNPCMVFAAPYASPEFGVELIP